MATKKNKLEKFNIGRAVVHVCYDTREEYSRPNIQFLEPGENGWERFTVTFQRHILKLTGNFVGDWERRHAVSQAATVSSGPLDVGAVAYSPCYAGKIDAHLDKLQMIAEVMAIIGKVTPPGRGEADELLLMVEGLRALGVPVEYQYHGRGSTFDHGFDVPNQYRCRSRELAESAEAQEILAEYHRAEAARRRERAATAEGEA